MIKIKKGMLGSIALILYLIIDSVQAICTTGQYWNPLNNACANQCPWSAPNLYYADPSSNSCVLTCPTTPSRYANDLLQKCVGSTQCPWSATNVSQQTYYDNVYRRCTLVCPANPSLYSNFDTQQCVQYCPIGKYALDTTRACTGTCPSFYYINYTLTNIERKCVAKCPADTFIDSTNFCVKATSCPLNQYGNPLTGRCVSECPGDGTIQLFADKNPNVKMCVYACPSGFYIQNITGSRWCVTSCQVNQYINYVTKKCVTNCSIGTFAFTDGRCLQACPSPFYAQNSSTVSGKCVTQCSGTKFRDDLSRTCVIQCPPGYFGDVNGPGATTQTYKCRKVCSLTTQYGNPLSRLCVTKSNCPSPYLYADDLGRQCVTKCPASQNTYGDAGANYCSLTCPWSVGNYQYKDPSTQKCVTDCPANPASYKDSGTFTCVLFCVSPYYAVQSTRSCELDCPNNFYKQNVTRKCVSDCPIDPILTYFYATNTTNSQCLATCPGSTLADPTTMSCISTLCPAFPTLFAYQNKCLPECPPLKYAHPDLRTCENNCIGLYFKDDSTHRCVLICPTNPNLFANTRTNTCVDQCDSDQFSDNSTRKCVSTCNASVGYIAYKPLKLCVLTCINNTYSHNGVCEQICPNATAPFYYIDITTKSCVQNCPDYYFKDDLLGKCVLLNGCSTGYYADHTQRKCVLHCNPAVYIYKDIDTFQCVKQCPYGTFGVYQNMNTKYCSVDCPEGWFADNSTSTCVQACPSTPSYYADIASKTCVAVCRQQLQLYAYDIANRTCVTQCPITTYADNFTRRCLIKCLLQPNTYQYTDPVTGIRQCRLECPIQYFADNSTRRCVTDCPSSPNYFAHWQSKKCVSVCPQTDVQKFYADNYTRTCVPDCPTTDNGTYRDPIIRVCMPTCTGLQYSDISTGDCVEICPWDPDLYGQLQNKTCVVKCDPIFNNYAENQTRTCVKKCPVVTYADDLTQRCVKLCFASRLQYGDPSTSKCVKKCPQIPSLYADNSTQECVHKCPNQTYGTHNTRVCQIPLDCPLDYYADPYTKLCVLKCPPTQQTYADIGTKKCLKVCPSNKFADNSTYKCVGTCPSTPSYYGHNLKCLQSCPNNTYADSISRLCVIAIYCNNTLTNLPTFADPSSQKCVTICPFDYYADIRSNKKICVKRCDTDFYADDLTKTCVPKCPQQNKTYGSNDTNKCVQVCPFGQYAQNTTRMCIKLCPPNSYADQNVRVCVSVCSATPNLYGNNYTNKCVQTCPSDPDLYADNSTRKCLHSCPFSQSTFADPLTRRCVLTCPVSGFSYADNQTRKCQTTCSYNDSFKSYADNSTLRCVTKCPDNPQYYADDSTKKCVYICPNTTVPRTYSDNTTRICQKICNQTALYFSDITRGTCLIKCPGGYFADLNSRSCVTKCPVNADLNINTYGDQGDRTCKSICQDGWFAQNSSRLCVQYCPKHQYANVNNKRCVQKCNEAIPEWADNSTNRCVKHCPTLPDLFADNLTNYKCVYTCQTDFWASNITVTGVTSRQCVQFCPIDPNGTYYFADNHTKRCVLKCPVNMARYADKVSQRCVSQCPSVGLNGSRTFADDSTKTCVYKCPILPWTYAENDTKICVFRCPPDSYGQNNTQQCVKNCSRWRTFADDSTTFCVSKCPADSFSDITTFTCVKQCPAGSYADNSTWMCVVQCPSNPALYAKKNPNVCVINCPDGLYGDDLTRNCVDVCPRQPLFFSYNLTQRCYRQCLYPYFGQVDIGKCVLSCEYGYYKNMTTHRCQKCVTNCLSCVSQLGCQSCSDGFYLFNGTCKTGCKTNTNPCQSDCPLNYLTGMITYASQVSGSCVQSCPNYYYGFNITLHCVKNCPINYYSFNQTRRCQLCINGCNNCTNATYCFSCYSGFLFSNNLCIKQCSETLAFYFQSACIAACIDGTYLMSDKVTCNKCSEKCATCSLTATNCTKCVGAFLYNFNCVSRCPTNFYANQNLICVPCQATTPQCNIQPLSYTLQSFTQNGKLYGILTFNRAVSIQISKIKQIVNITLNGIPSSKYTWDAVKINDTAFRINIKTTVSLNQMSLSFKFLKPDLVIDSAGTVLTETQIQSPLPSFDYISVDIQQSTKSISSFGGVLSYVALVILVALLFKGSYPLLFVTEVFQHIYFHYFVIQELPFNYSNFLISLKNLNFQFLPNFFNTFIPATYQSLQTPTKFKQAIIDTTFFISAGHYITLIIAYVIWAFAVSLLKNKSINKFQKIRKFFKDTFLRRVRFNAINECLWFCFMTFVIFGLWQFRDLSIQYDWSYGNIILSSLCLLLCVLLVIWNIYLSLSYRKDMQRVPTKYNFILGDDSTIPYQMPLRYIRKLLICIFLFLGTIQLQIIGMIGSNFIVFAFYLYFKPSKSKFTNYINILIELCYLSLQISILSFINSVGLTTQQKLYYGNIMFGISLTALFLSLIWLIWQFMQFMYDFKFIRDIIQQTKLANQIHPDQDNLKIQFDKDYQKDQVISNHISENQAQSDQTLTQNNHIQGIQNKYQKNNQKQSKYLKDNSKMSRNTNIKINDLNQDDILHYDGSQLQLNTKLKPLKPLKNNKSKKYQQISDNSQNSSRIISSRGSNRLLFGDITIQELQ